MTHDIVYMDIPLEKLEIGMSQVRLSDVSKDIDELASSIDKVGLLEPILVAKSQTNDDKYEIILGQRRFIAHQKLQKDTIKAGVLEERLSEIEAKVLSVTENLVRSDLPRKDLIDVCTFLYKKYGSIKDVVQETGLSDNKVRSYVKYDRLIKELKDLVDNNEVDLNAALRAQDAIFVMDDTDTEGAVKLAKEMSHMSGAQQKKIIKTATEKPSSSVDSMVEDAKGGGKITQIIVTIGETLHNSLNEYAKDEEMNQDDAAAMLIEDGLLSKGYMKEN